MLLRKAFPFASLLDETLGDLQHLRFSRSSPLPAPLWPDALLLAPLHTSRCSLPLLSSPFHYLFGNSHHFLESGGMLTFSTQSAECWERREEALQLHTVLLFPGLALDPRA